MVFSSPLFLFLFLPVTLILVYLTQRFKIRNTVLLILSMFFYAFGEGELIILMFISITLNYYFGKWIDANRKSKWPIGIGVTVNIALLVVYKYASFFIESINYLLSLAGMQEMKQVHIKLPVGISFYTFHSISYLIDVYRRQNESQKSYIDLALYICLFPQLVAGPIIRYKDVALQFTSRILTRPLFQRGVERFIIGLGKKVIIANSIGMVADEMFSLPVNEFSTPAAWFAIICYSLQLYFDFSGYSDMAIGLGKMLGFNFLENFRFPYKAKSIREFWQRWHISLSNWFRDYLYIPLGGNRVSAGRVYLNLFIVFFLTGLWHGASWNFVIWGLLHGFFMIVERIGFGKIMDRMPALVQHVYTLTVVVVAWVFFRVESLPGALAFVERLFVWNSQPIFTTAMFLNREVIVALIAGSVMAFDGFNYMLRKFSVANMRNVSSREVFKDVARNVRSIFLLIVFIYCALTIAAGSYNPFIYFRF